MKYVVSTKSIVPSQLNKMTPMEISSAELPRHSKKLTF